MSCICERKAVYEENGDWDCLENEEGIEVRPDVSLACGVDCEGFYLVANGECNQADWHPFYCPICGRKLKEPDPSFHTIPGRYWE